MASKKRSTRVNVAFTDIILANPIEVDVPGLETSSEFAYNLRRVLFKEKRIAPINQVINKVGDKQYTLTIRRRGDNLTKLTIHGHAANEYDLYVDNNDTIMDIKFLLSPLIDAKPEYIQLNYNTERRLKDDENIIKSNCLSDEIVIMWWLELPNPNGYKGETPIYRSTSHLIGVNPTYPNLAVTLRKTLKEFAEEGTKTWGVRQFLDKNDFSKRGEYIWTDYKTINERVTNIASGFRCLGLRPHKSKIGICSGNRREWVLSDYGAQVQSMISIPLYSTLDKHAIEYIVNHAGIELVVCSAAVLPQVNKARALCKTLKYIVLMDEELPDQVYVQEKDPNRKTYTHLLSEVEKLGSDKPFDDVVPSQDEISTIMYTSGTTGNPKGVMITHRNFACFINAVTCLNLEEKYEIVDPHHLSYLPLAHAYERVVNLACIIQGTPIGFISSYPGLLDDMKILKPIVFYGVPRVFQKFQDGIMQKVNSSNFLFRALFKYAYNQKLYAIQHRKDPSKFWDYFLWSKLREPFGGARFAGSGSAPLSREAQLFLKVTLYEAIGEGYGLTETLGSGTASHVFDVKVGHVGVPGLNIEIKLIDVPDMGYLTTDKPVPRGEICIRGPTVFKGYYKEPEKTKAVLSNDGWFATGDIGIWREEGRLEIVDRKKNIFKLAQGEYIRPEYIQNVYKQGRFVGNCFVDGNSLETYLVAIVVPDFEALIPFINNPNNGLIDLSGKSKEIIINDERIINLIKECMKIQEEKAELNGFEKVKKFVLKQQEFSQENGLLTNSMKLKRNVARQTFADDIKNLYKKQSKL